MRADAPAHPSAEPALRRAVRAVKAGWPQIRRWLTGAFLLLVAVLLVRQARQVDWLQVGQALRGYSASTLLLAAALAALSYATYCTYDLIGRHQTGHRLATRQVLGIGFVSYAFNLNLGAFIGGFAFRQKLYSASGLETAVIARLYALSVLTNWLGYLVLAGLVFTLRPPALPPDWKIGSHGLPYLGAALLALAAGYVGACWLRSRADHRGPALLRHLPSARVAAVQLAVSSLNWALIAAILYVILRQRIDYPTVLAVVLVAAVAGAISHVPAGLGVLEAVFVALLSHRLPQNELLAALLAYRAIYYLAPLAGAVLVFVPMNRRLRAAKDGAPTS